MKSYSLSWLIFTLLFISCGQEVSTERKLTSDYVLSERLKTEITSGQETIHFEEIADFDWESLIILTPYSLPKRIGEEFKIDLTAIEHFRIDERDDINLIIFLNKNIPIRVIEYPRYPGDFSGNKIEIIEKSNSIFEVFMTDGKNVEGDQWIRLKKK